MRFLRILAGRQLSCGCLVGTYQLYDGRIVTVLDVRSPACPNATHFDDRILPPEAPPGSPGTTAGAPALDDLSSRLN
jgi:hypothetical protein